MRTIRLAGTSALIMLLMGCGGGGSSTTTPTTYNLDALVSRYVRQTHNYTLTASDSGNIYLLKLSTVPGPSASFDGVTADTSVNTVELFENGTLIASDVDTRYYDVNPYEAFGNYDATTGYVTIAANQVELPTAAKVGQTGTVDTETTFYDTSLTTVFGTETNTWRVDAGSGSDAVFCADTSGSSASGSISESDCYTTDAAGNVSGLTITLLINGVTLTFS